ncbi:hypothetical protein [Taibaiella helva]|uniref:hypothetical protein n=1 Tax=Taibaiella helva TaxID=2301235 RepID=UPI000E579AD3|nr:hypothetical protein [Taibaiella helva]
MKKVGLVLLFSAIVSGAWARVPGGHFLDGFGHRVIVVNGGLYHPFYSTWGFNYGYPYYNSITPPPSKLDIEIAGIRNDYADKIRSVKMDPSLTKSERKAQVKIFREERKLDVINAERNYYKS